MSTKKPDGWVWISPEGEYTGNDDIIVIDRVKNIKQEELEQHAKLGYTTKSVCLISPADLDRYERLREWAKKVKPLLESYFLYAADNILSDQYIVELEQIMSEQGK